MNRHARRVEAARARTGGLGASVQCPHSDVHFGLNEQRFGDTNIRYLEITGDCKICGNKVAFRGAAFGLSPAQPTMAIDGGTINLPFLFGDEELTGDPAGFTGRMVAP